MADSKISALTAVTSLAAGDEMAVAHAGASNKIRADHMHGFELDYAQITANVSITAIADGNSGGTAVIDGNAVTYDGLTVVIVEVYVPRFVVNAVSAPSAHSGYLNLYDGTTDLGRIAQLQDPAAGVNLSAPVLARRKLTPSSGAHTYHVRGWKDASGDVVSVLCGAGGASALMPAYMRITVA